MDLESIKAQVLNLPEVAAWPEMANIFERAATHPRQVWEWPLFACQAVGGDVSAIAPGAAATLCMMLSITLVDDMLDDDPRGAHLQIGPGATANLAFAFQAAAFRLVANTAADAECRAAVLASLAQMALTTAFGQNSDVQNLGGEENYWKIVRAKSTPFYGSALYIGALLGGGSLQAAERLRDFGVLSGEVIQIYDDLIDALQSPPNPDWKRGRNNLAILYTLTANHPDRERFGVLLPQVDNPEALQAAQQILIRSGAVSYCAYQVIKRCRTARQIIDSTSLANSTPLRNVLTEHIKPLVILLENVGVTIPSELEAV